MERGKVSIITPCYNGSKYIGETISSVLQQTYNNWEMIIIDDGSSDNSVKIIKEYIKTDGRITLIEQENAGSAAARNAGIRVADGQYITLLDADDIWLPKFLDEQISFLKEKGAVCVASAYGHIDENSNDILHTTKVKKVITARSMRVMNRIGCLTGVYDASKYGKIFLREELKSIRDDYAYWYDIVKLEDKAYGNQKVLAKYRVLKTSVTSNKKNLIKKQYYFYRKYLNESVPEAIVNVIRWGISGLLKFNL